MQIDDELFLNGILKNSNEDALTKNQIIIKCLERFKIIN